MLLKKKGGLFVFATFRKLLLSMFHFIPHRGVIIYVISNENERISKAKFWFVCCRNVHDLLQFWIVSLGADWESRPCSSLVDSHTFLIVWLLMHTIHGTVAYPTQFPNLPIAHKIEIYKTGSFTVDLSYIT